MGKTVRNFYKNAKTIKKQSKNQKRNKNKNKIKQKEE